VIINKGKIVANEKTENISSAVDKSRRFNAKICGPQKDVLTVLRSMPGIAYAEALAERDGDAYTYLVESEYGVDIRKNLFFSLAEKGWAMIGMEALGMSLEDIFITVVDKSEGTDKNARRDARKSSARKTRSGLEADVAGNLYREAEARRREAEQEALTNNRDEDDEV
jgi:ABC-2 type transport system ATP-binding protein